MARWSTFVLFLVTGLTLFVNACGKNPEKQRVMTDSSQEVLPNLSDKEYVAASGNSFSVDKDTKAITYRATIEGKSIEVLFNTNSQQLEFRDRTGAGKLILTKTQVEDEFKALMDDWEEFKASTEDPIKSGEWKQWKYKNMSLTTTCTETRKGEWLAAYKRPEDSSVTYRDYEVVDKFKSHPDARWVISANSYHDRESLQGSVDGVEDTLLSPYLKLPEVQEFLVQLCDLQSDYDEAFRGLFSSDFGGGYYVDGNVDSFIIPVEFINPEVLQLAGAYKAPNLHRIGNSVFSIEEVKMDLTKILATRMQGQLQSGAFGNGEWDTKTQGYVYKKLFDSSRQRVSFDWEKTSFFYSDFDGDQTCKNRLEGSITEAYHSTRMSRKFANTVRVNVKLTKVTSSANCTDAFSNLKQGDSVSVYVKFRDDRTEIVVNLLDDAKNTLLVSGKTFIQ